MVKQQTEVEQQETEFVSVVGFALLTLFKFFDAHNRRNLRGSN